MKLYKVETGATYWIAANDADQALALAREQEVMADCEASADEAMAGVVAQELSEAAASKTKVQGDGETCSLWEEFQKATEPVVVACSEW